MDMRTKILELKEDPQALELLYREDPERFAAAFHSAQADWPDSSIRQAWLARLAYEAKPMEKNPGRPITRQSFLLMGLLAVLSGVSTRILLYFAEADRLAPVSLLYGVMPFMAAYFIYQNKASKKLAGLLAGVVIGSAAYLNALPLDYKDSTVMAYLHLPILLWVLLGGAFAGEAFRKHEARLDYIKFNGAFGIVYAIMAIGGMLLTGLTMQLFNLIGMDISEFYFSNVVLFGAAALAVVGTVLTGGSLQLGRQISPYIAKIFCPLVLLTLVGYLGVVVWLGKNPFLDRNFLIAFNGVLLSVLTVSIFSIAENGPEAKKRPSDYVNFALILLTLLIDGVALSAMSFRLGAFGITPNRIAVLGINLIIGGHLIWILRTYVPFLRDERSTAAIQRAVTGYLPVYGLWAGFVTFVFPLIF